MTLSAPIVSPARTQPQQLSIFAQWESDAAINDFLSVIRLGQTLSAGWHVRLEFQRRWGHGSEFGGLAESVGERRKIRSHPSWSFLHGPSFPRADTFASAISWAATG